ncbi:hypothetical protein N7478_010477 [Penicillium angulare]|uniref:uncharacterized protein n=1 Tax=Penicillium angulare TaxID=116970 RepID=UPI0025407A7B|nr:uncharacterized protein N7478_010300 [Penicillium angulare]XP_056776061.1 uncharacterized protein N7478_010477 [Penicillium angulare]KAJ5267492.1 hypothetical protein N7478_010300 [Penicillium angulare]KAJ5267669.1 hypothetical protein N7478_010477 [Penicillium angulare]
MPASPSPVPADDDSDASSVLPDVFSNNASDSDSSTAASDLDTSSESEAELESEDELALDDEEEQLSPEHYLREAESLDVSKLRQKRYSPKTQERLDETQDFWDRFCRGTNRDPVECLSWLSDTEQTVRFLKALFSWRCDQRRGKDGRRTAGVNKKSTLDAFWKWWHLIYTAEVGHGLSKDIQVKVRDVLAIVATDKKLSLKKRPKATMYVEDVAEFARVILSTTEMTFPCGWYRIQLLLFCQLAAITGSRPGALLQLRFQDLKLTLIRDPDGGRPRLFIYLRPEFTKSFLGEKESNTFPIPEIIFDPTLVLSPHVFLLGMLFRIGAFKSLSKDGPVMNCPEKLYSLRVLSGLGQQELKLKDEILDRHVFCHALREPDGIRIALEKSLNKGWLSYRMKRGGEITGFEEVAKPYCLRYGAAKAFNDSPDVSNELQNVMLQHASIDTFVRHYSVGIHVDTQAIVRGLPAQKQLMRFACSMSRSIDPRRPYRLEDSSCINDIPHVHSLEERKQARSRIRDVKKRTYENAQAAFQREFGDDPPQKSPATQGFRRIHKRWRTQKKNVEKLCQKYDRAEDLFQHSVRQLRNEKRRQKHRLIRENLERYKEEQPVIDSERQLAGKVVDEEVMGALQRTGYMTPQHMTLIDSVLTMPGKTVEKETERRIAAINAVIAVCDAEEGAPSRPPPQKRPLDAVDVPAAAPVPKRQNFTLPEERDDTFSQAIASVCVKNEKERPTICFICLGNAGLPENERLRMYKNPGSLSRHFVNRHIKPFPNDMHCQCHVCGEKLMSKSGLLNHAERVHGTVSCLPLPSLGLQLS